MNKTIITPVGISIFTNYKDKSSVVRDYPQLNRDYESIEHQFDRLKDLSPHYERMTSRYESDINYIKQRIKYLWLAEAKEKSSAELQTLFEIAKAETSNLEVHLLATDTVLSVVACELIQEWLMENPVINGLIVTCLYHFNTHAVNGLQVKDSIRFKTEGIQNLLKIIKQNKTNNAIINMSGGYKGLTPFLTLVGQIEGMSLVYLYEESNQIINIGKMPFNFDWGIIEKYAAFILDCSMVTGRKVDELETLGIIEYGQRPIVLTTLGDLMKAYLLNQDIPFEKTVMGYLVEYKFYEYYSLNNHAGFSDIELGYKLSDVEGEDLEDADLWMSNKHNEVVIAEIKPASISSKNLKNKIKKIIEFAQKKPVEIKEFWVLLYEYEDQPQKNDQNWCKSAINDEVLYLKEGLVFEIKKIVIPQNTLDGKRNRIQHQEFMRNKIPDIQNIYSTKHN